MTTPNQKTLAEMPLDKSGTSKPFSVSGPWRAHTAGVWFGKVRIESRENEWGGWHAERALVAVGDRNFEACGLVGPADTNRYFRLSFRKRRVKWMRDEAALVIATPKLYFCADGAVIDP